MRRTPVLPYVACAMMSAVTVQAYGEALGAQSPANLLTYGVLAGTAISLLVRFAGRSGTWLGIGPWLGVMLATLGWFGAGALNGTLADGSLLEQAPMGASVLWLLVLRSPILWTDTDVAFQAVPSMAVFGVAAGYAQDDATFLALFLVYLVCTAYLLAWKHSSSILEARYGSGKVHPSAFVAARPTYALATTGVVIAASFLVAPVIRTTMEHTVSPIILSAAAARIGPPGRLRPRLFDDLDIVGGTYNSTNAVVLEVRAPRPLYLRERAFGEFTGTRWHSVGAGPTGRGTGYWIRGTQADLRDMEPTYIRERTTAVTQDVVIRSGVHNWVCSASEPVSVDIRPGTANDQVAGFGYVPEVGVICRSGLGEGAQYRVQSLLPPQRTQELMAAHADRETGIYTQLPSERSSQLYDVAQQVTAGATTDYERVEALRSYVARTCQYSTNAPPLTSPTDRASEFLFSVKVGYCDAYATALCVLCRELGMQARVVRGYAPGDFDKSTGTYTVREKHYHLWTEVNFAGIGWLIFDATEGTNDLDQSNTAISKTEPSQLLLRSKWVTGLIDATVILVLAYLAWTVFRQRYRRIVATGPRGQVAAIYGDFVRSAQRAGLPPRRPQDTPSEHLAMVFPSLPDRLRERASDIVRRANEALFGSHVPADAVGALRGLVLGWAKEMRDLRKRRQ